MNILLISASAPPKSGAESLQVAKYLKYLSGKANITLVTTRIPDGGWKKKDDSQLKYLKNIRQLVQLPSLASFGRWKGFISKKIFHLWLHKPDADFFFHWRARKIIKAFHDQPQLIYSRSTPFSSAVLALKLQKRLNIPWVMHLSDPWSDSSYGDHTNSYNKAAEQACFSAATGISFTTDSTKTFYTHKYPDLAARFFVSPNVFDKDEITAAPEVFLGGKLTFLHSGNLYRQRNIQPLLDALQRLTDSERSGIEVELAGHMDPCNVEMIDRSSLGCIRILGSLTADESRRLQQKADVLISIDKPIEQEIDKVFLPSKIQDYIAARKIILAITGTGSATYNTVQDRFGCCFDHSDPNNIAGFFRRALKAFNSQDRDFFVMGQPGPEFEAGYNAELLIDRFKKLVEEHGI